MGARLRSNRQAAVQRSREQRASDLNAARDEQLDYERHRVPVDSGRLQKTIRKGADATPQSLRAEAMVGGMKIDGVTVDYEGLVNFGHATVNGGHVPADPFHTESEEVGKAALERRVGGTVRVERS